MKKALIFEGRLVEVAAVAFPVAPAMSWIDVADDVTPETHEFDGTAAVLMPPKQQPTSTYKELRAAAYPSFADQFDLIYHGGIALWKEAIDAVKTKYPKS